MPGTGNISANPLFNAPIIFDFSLQVGSPCIGAGQDGFEIGAVPYTVRPGMPTSVELTPQGDTPYVQLDWVNPTHDTSGNALTTIGRVILYRDGVEVASLTGALPGGSVSYTEEVPQSDYYRYCISVMKDGVEGIRAYCAESWIGGPVSGIVIWDLGRSSDSAAEIQTALLASSYSDTVRLADTPSRYELTAAVDAVFVCLGVYDQNHALTSEEGDTLSTFLDSGGCVYLEGGDTWAFDPPTSVHPYFAIDGLSDGSSDCGPVAGVESTFTEGMNFEYDGVNGWIDHLAPLDTAFTVLRNGDPVYDSCVAYVGPGGYRTIGCSFDFGGLVDAGSPSTAGELMASYLDFFGLLGPVETVGVDLTCSPAAGTLPFNTQVWCRLDNLTGESRTLAARIDLTIAAGMVYTNYRSGHRNMAPAEIYTVHWSQALPALGNLVGDNILTLYGEDVTAAPFNQPPYAPSGDTDISVFTVTGMSQ